MAKPDRREQKPSNEIARFTDREDQLALFHHYVNSATEPPVLMFFGIGGAGKSWLLKKLRQETPADVPSAILDFDVQAGGQRFVLDPATALWFQGVSDLRWWYLRRISDSSRRAA